MKPNDLTTVLKDATPGEWVALSMDQQRIVGRGQNGKQAHDAAAKAGELPVILFHVPLATVDHQPATLRSLVAELSDAWELDPHGQRFTDALFALQEYAEAE